MSSLSGLLARIASIPPDELKPGKSEADRPIERSLIHQVLSKEQIEKARLNHPNQARIKSACYPRREAFEMEFQVPNGGFHKVVASYGSKGLRVTDNDQPIPIGDSVAEFRDHLLRLTEENNQAGAS